MRTAIAGARGGTGARRNEARRLLSGLGRTKRRTGLNSCWLRSREGEFAVRDGGTGGLLAARGSSEGSEMVVGLERHFHKNVGGGWSWFGTIEKFSLDLHNTIF